MNLPYAGSGVLASALAANKAAARRMFQQAGLPVAKGKEVTQADHDNALARELRSVLGAAVVVKPVSGGSAIGVSRVRAADADDVLDAALRAAFAVDRSLVVEAFSLGDEVTCGVLEDASGVPIALPPTRIVAKAADWYDFKSRYGTLGSEHQCPAPYAPALGEKIQRVAVAAHRAVGARDLSRVDFIVSPESEHLTLLEVNTLPGMTPTSLFPEAAGVSGVDFNTLCQRLAHNALNRGSRQAPRVRPMPD
jgi:D-alanine-D-alanine ligase